MERTFIVIKPDGVQRGIIGKIITRLENKGFKLIAMKFIKVGNNLASIHYAEHKDKPFFKSLVNFLTSGPIVIMVWEGKNIVSTLRTLMGKTNPSEAGIGTIRGDFGIDIGRNVIHGSDSIESANREISLFFKDDELVSWEKEIHKWIYE